MDIHPQPYLASQVVCSVDLKGFLCKFSIIVLYWITSIYCLGGIYANYDYMVHLSDDQVLIVLILMYSIHVHCNNNKSYCIGIIFIYYLIMIIQNPILYFLQIHIWQRTLNCANLYDFAIWFTWCYVLCSEQYNMKLTHNQFHVTVELYSSFTDRLDCLSTQN